MALIYYDNFHTGLENLMYFSTQNVNMKNSYWYCPNCLRANENAAKQLVVIITIYYQIFDMYIVLGIANIICIYKNNGGLLLIN